MENYEIPENDIYNLQKLGFAGSSGVVMEREDLIRNETYIYYLMEGDIEIRKDDLKAMAEKSSRDSYSQYHTTNLVDSQYHIKIIGVNVWNQDIRQGFIQAIDN